MTINTTPPELPRVTTGPLPASTKVWKAGTLHPDIRVPMREIALHPSAGEPNVRVYDASGPYTDAEAAIDTATGLPRPREAWIDARGDTETYEGRRIRPEDNGRDGASGKLRPFPRAHAPRRATGDRPVTQLAYARAASSHPKWNMSRSARTWAATPPSPDRATAKASARRSRTT